MARGGISAHPLHSYCAAISVGIVGGTPVLDLPYVEDSTADVDMNVVMLRPVTGGEPRFVEVQGTAEGMAFSRGELDQLLALAEGGLAQIADLQAETVSVPPDRPLVITLVCASANPDKVAEIQAILGDAVQLLPRPAEVPDVVEDADTLIGNARLKAAAIAAATGAPAVADDTGLEVDALGGAPGVWSARYAGEDATYADNRHKLLMRARWRGGPDRLGSGRWRWWCGPTDASWPSTVCARARSPRPSGASGGSATTRSSSPTDGDGRSFAEMTEAEKSAVSHRGRAFRGLLARLDVVSDDDGRVTTKPR